MEKAYIIFFAGYCTGFTILTSYLANHASLNRYLTFRRFWMITLGYYLINSWIALYLDLPDGQEMFQSPILITASYLVVLLTNLHVRHIYKNAPHMTIALISTSVIFTGILLIQLHERQLLPF